MASQEVKAGAAYVELFVKDNKLSAGLRAASKRIQQWAKDTKKYLQGIGTSFMNFGTRGLMLGAGLGGGLFAMAKSFADAGDTIEKMSQRTGMSAEALSELGYAAQQCGADIGAVEKGIQLMGKAMFEAQHGSQGAIDKFAQLGLAYQQLAKLSPEEQFATIIERLGQMDESKRAVYAMSLFGKSASQLVPLINAGAGGIAELRAEARQLGVSMSTTDAQAATTLADAFTRVQASMKGLTNHIGAALAPELTLLVNRLVKYTASAIQIIKRNRTLIVSMAKWAAIIAAVSGGLITLGISFMGLGTVAGAALCAVALSLKIVAGLVTFLVSPIGIAIVAIGGLLWYLGAIGSAIKWLKGTWESLFSTATKAWSGICDAIAAGRIDLAMKVTWTGIKLVWTEGIDFLYKWWLWIQNEVMNAWDTTVHGLMTAWIKYQRFAFGMFHGLQAGWTILSKGIRDTWAVCMLNFLNGWDYASTHVAKGLAWIYGKLSGLDADELVRIVMEDHVHRTKERTAGFDSDQQKRDAQFENDFATIGQKNLNVNNWLDEQQKKENTAYAVKQAARQSAYEKRLAELGIERLQAEQEFNDAIAEATAARAAFAPDAPVDWKPTKLPDFGDDIAEAIADSITRGIESVQKTVSRFTSGTFNAGALRYQKRADDPILKVVEHTGQTAKYTKQQFQQTQRLGYPAIVAR
jgi:hypothetical protein